MSLDSTIIDYLIRIFTTKNDDNENDTSNNKQSSNNNNNNNNNNNTTIVLHLEEECKSAQQRVVIIRLSYVDSTTITGKSSPCRTTDVTSNNAAGTDTTSATDTNTSTTGNTTDSTILAIIKNGTIPTVWETILLNSNNRFVIRIWYGASRWWNLHHPFFNHDTDATTDSTGSTITSTTSSTNNKLLQSIAQKELWGYDTAYKVFQSSKNYTCTKQTKSESMIRIPKVLYSSLADNDTSSNNISWAILEYVGKQSRMYDNHSNNTSNTTKPTTIVLESSTSNSSNNNNNVDLLSYDDTYVKSMIQYRDEFGYTNVQHLRWGRLPITISLQYAELVLYTIIVPIHTYYFHHHNNNNNNTGNGNTHTDTCIENNSPITYHSMIQLYKRIYHCELEQCCGCDKHLSSSVQVGVLSNDFLLQTWFIQTLQLAIDQLEYESTTTENLATILICQQPVLCHMDYQPQNLIFAKKSRRENDDNNDNYEDNNNNPPFIVSILDWEEAEFADPRFDLLMICRKVCANRQQATTIWNKYNQIFSISSETNPIEPWFKLETVHCIITLLLQLHNISVGRNSPNKQSELIHNIKCEFQRLHWAGWEFCCLAPASL